MLEFLRHSSVRLLHLVLLALCFNLYAPFLQGAYGWTTPATASGIDMAELCTMSGADAPATVTANGQDSSTPDPAGPHRPAGPHCPCCPSLGGCSPALSGPLPDLRVAAPSFFSYRLPLAAVSAAPVMRRPGHDARPRAPPRLS